MDFSLRATRPNVVWVPNVLTRFYSRHRLELFAVAVWTAIRLIVIATVAVVEIRSGRAPFRYLGAYDAVWYAKIAEVGYDHGGTGTTLAFFPLYPVLIRVGAFITPFNATQVGILIALASGMAAVWGMCAIVKIVSPKWPMTGPFLAVAWAVIPEGSIETMAYTEAPFTALVAWALLFALKKDWGWAGLLAFLAGLTRLTAPALIVPVMLACAIALVRARGRSPKAWFGLVASPLGWLGYLAWSGLRVGSITGYREIQMVDWNHQRGNGRSLFLDVIAEIGGETTLANWVTIGFVVFAVVMIIFLVLDRKPWLLTTFAVLTMIGTVGTMDMGQFWVLSRYFIPMFPILIPVAEGLASIRRAKAWIIVAALTLFAGYNGVYMATIFAHWP
jgi:hypothetical protein